MAASVVESTGAAAAGQIVAATQNAAHARRPRVLFINRSFPPDDGATGRLLIQLVSDLAITYDVTVIVGPRPSGLPEVKLPPGVTVRRAKGVRTSKRSLLRRIFGLLSFLIGATWQGLIASRPDLIVVETDPPLLSLLGVLLKWRFRCPLVIYLQDLHPEIAIAVGALRPGLLTSLIGRLLRAAYRRADRIILVGEDMRKYLAGLCPTASARMCVIPNWADTSQVRPLTTRNSFRGAHAPRAKTVVMYSGNLGLTQRLETLLDAAEQLRDHADILFLIVGSGAAGSRLRDLAQLKGLDNVRFLPYQAEAMLGESLSAADLHFVPLMPSVSRFLMPSKLYGVLAAGRPLVAAAPADSELAALVVQEEVGFLVPPENGNALAAAILDASRMPESLQQMGLRARRSAEQRFDRMYVTGRFGAELESILAEKNIAKS